MTCASCGTDVDTDVEGVGAAGGRVMDMVASSLACITVATACVGCGTVIGTGVGRAGATGDRPKI